LTRKKLYASNNQYYTFKNDYKKVILFAMDESKHRPLTVCDATRRLKSGTFISDDGNEFPI